MKASIKTDPVSGHVTLAFDDAYTGERITREFFCPTNGGYVREWDEKRLFPQVCHGLGRTGNTLVSPTLSHLAGIIRLEYRAMRRAEVAQFAAERA